MYSSKLTNNEIKQLFQFLLKLFGDRFKYIKDMNHTHFVVISNLVDFKGKTKEIHWIEFVTKYVIPKLTIIKKEQDILMMTFLEEAFKNGNSVNYLINYSKNNKKDLSCLIFKKH